MFSTYDVSLCLIFIDGVLNLILFCSVQLSATFYISEFDVQGYIVCSQSSLYGAVYFLLREILEVWALPSKIFFGKVTAWKIADWLSVTFIFLTYFVMDSQFNEETTDSVEIYDQLRNLIATATLLQALSLVSYLRFLNEHMAVFISSLSKVRILI